MKHFIITGLLLFILQLGICFSQQHSPDNQTVMSDLMEVIAENVIEKYGLKQKELIVCSDLHGADEGKSWLMDRFYRKLSDSGVRIHFKAEEPTALYQLSLNLIHLYIDYDGIYRRRLWSRGETIRKAGIILACRLIQGQNAVFLSADDFHQHAQDTVALRHLDILERGQIIVRKPERPGERGIRKWIEPLIFGLALAGMAYTFYTVRSR